jgi:hypothetical protein
VERECQKSLAHPGQTAGGVFVAAYLTKGGSAVY